MSVRLVKCLCRLLAGVVAIILLHTTTTPTTAIAPSAGEQLQATSIEAYNADNRSSSTDSGFRLTGLEMGGGSVCGTQEPSAGPIGSSSVLLAGKRRSKRQASGGWWSSCPTRAAYGGSDNGRGSFLLFYSPSQRRDLTIGLGGGGSSNNGRASAASTRLLVARGFDRTKPTLLYMHAFYQSARSQWLMDIRSRFNELFPWDQEQRPTFNLLFFDWSSYSRRRYSDSVSWVPPVGQALGEFLAELASAQAYNMSQMHLISYSLSTHISGVAGRHLTQRTGQQVGQITALDPTGVCLHEDTQFADKYSLRSTDARMVVARHYDMFGFGARRTIGGVDVFVNGGKNQPSDGNGRGYARSHSRAAEHESQEELDNADCQEVAYACRSYQAFLDGECADCGPTNTGCYYIGTLGNRKLIDQWGLQANAPLYPSGTQMYIETMAEKPFCLPHYQLVARLRPGASSRSRQLLESGSVSFDFGLGGQEQFVATHQVDSVTFTALILVDSKLGNLDNVVMRFQSNVREDETEEFKRTFEGLSLNYMSNALASNRAAASARFCWEALRRALVRC